MLHLAHLHRRISRLVRFTALMSGVQLRAAMEYRWSFLSQVLFMVLNDLSLVFFWWAVFERFGSMGGWNMREMLLLYAVGTTGFGITVGLFGNVNRLSRQIAHGGLDAVLCMPPDPMHNILVSGVNVSAWGDFLFGVTLYALVGDLTPWGILLFGMVTCCSAAVMLGFFVAAHSLAFFLGSAEGLSGLLANALITFSLYPPAAFQGWTRVLLYTALPAGFMTYVPVEILQEFSLSKLLLLVAMAAASVSLGRLVFLTGLRRYESGSLMVSRGT